MQNQPHRLERLYKHNPLYFVPTCTENRKHILANDTIHEAFIRFCQCGLARGVFIGRYVLMPDHLHLFIRFGQEYEQTLIERRKARHDNREAVAAVYDRHPDLHVSSLSSWMKSLKNSLSKMLNSMDHKAPHWQKGFFDRVLRNSESYSEKWRYVVQNPVRAGLVQD